jgi:type I restriction enzyme, S subunit
MKLETFFEKFELFSEAPGAVSRLRGLVVELAVQGGLVLHSPQETPIPYESDKDAVPINTTDTPANWRVVLLADAIKNRSGNSKLIKGKLHDEPTPDLFQGFSASGADVWCDDYEHEGEAIIISAVGARCGKAFKASGKWCAIANTNIARPDTALLNFDFAYLILNNEHFWLRGGSAQPFVKFPPSLNRNFALPPIAEQKRIVAKVDELMALCDQLEAQQQERESQRAKIARASLSRFAEVPTPANLASLFHSSYGITPTDLRKSVLTLAVRGKLVTQDSNDEPAAKCLSRLGLKNTDTSLDALWKEDGSLPSTWARVRFDDVALVSGGVTLGRKLGERKTLNFPYLRVANVKRGEIDLTLVKEVSIAEDEIERYSLRENDLLMTEGGDWDKVGRAAVWRAEIPTCLHQNHVFRARMRSAELTPFWFERYFNSPVGRSYFESASKQTTNLASINMRQVRSCPIPLPPLAEQHRIVAKVEELMAMVDQLEAQLAKEKSASTALLDAAIHELLNPSADIIPFPAAQATAIDRAGIGCYVVQKLAGHKTFGRVALMKHEYLAEAHVGVNLDGQYQRQAAGPLDSWVYRFEEEAGREGWFTVEETKTRDGHKKIVYRKGTELDAKVSAAFTALPQAQRDELDRMLKLLGGKPTEEVEIIATLFAVWNDFLIDGHSPRDEDIVTGFREHWHQEKQKFTAKSLHTWLDWMRRNGLVPTGRGPRTQPPSRLPMH